MMEVLVTMVLIVIALLGLAALQARTSTVQMEVYQRAQALMLAQDMADRISARKASAANYVANDYGIGATQSCTGLTGFAMDTCNWGNAIRGASELVGSTRVGTLLGGRGCISNVSAGQYAVIVVWQGLVSTKAPGVACGQGNYGSETMRRAVVVPIRMADLTAS